MITGEQRCVFTKERGGGLAGEANIPSTQTMPACEAIKPSLETESRENIM